MKKFKELEPGDIVYNMRKCDLQRGVLEMKVLTSWKVIAGEETCETDKGRLIIPMYCYERSYSSQLYDIYSTSREELLKGSEKFVILEIERLQGRIEEKEKEIGRLKKEMDRLDYLLIEE